MHEQFCGSPAFIPTDIAYAKAKAKLIRKLLPEATLSLAQAQQLTARAMGHVDWHALDAAVRGTHAPSPVSAKLSPEEQAARWRCQKTALLSQPGIDPSEVSNALEDWALTGHTRAPDTVSDSDIEDALDRLWPKDNSQLQAEVRASVAAVVQRTVWHLAITRQMPKKMRATNFEFLLGPWLTESPMPLMSRYDGKISSVKMELKHELLFANATISQLQDATIELLLGPGARSEKSRFTSIAVIQGTVANRLYPLALAYGTGRTLWELYFAQPSPDGLIRYQNSRTGFVLDNGRRGDDGEYEGEEDADEHSTALPPHARLIQTKRLFRELEISMLQSPAYTEYSDKIRVTNLAILVRNAAGDNVAFADARLYESGHKRVSKDEFWDLADSESLASLEMADAVLGQFPRVTQCFGKGSFVYLEELELAKQVRGGDCSAMIVEAIVEHCRELAGPVAAICVDARPPQFPLMKQESLALEVRAEAMRVNQKLGARARSILGRPTLAKIPTRLVRFCYPDDHVEKL